MAQHDVSRTSLNIADFEFDGTQFAKTPAEPGASGTVEWYAMERGSDEHIAVLEQIVAQLQATLAELKVWRAARGR